MPSPYASLQRTEALARRRLLDLTSYDVALDLATDDATFRSVTTIRFSSRAGRRSSTSSRSALHAARAQRAARSTSTCSTAAGSRSS